MAGLFNFDKLVEEMKRASGMQGGPQGGFSGGPQGFDGSQGGFGGSQGSAPGGDDVVDGDYKEV